jgi:gliding motility-associated-like protein
MTLSLFRNIFLQILLLSISSFGYAQGSTCNSAEPFCTGTGDIFSNTTGAGNAQSGPNYGCLGSTPNPSWFFMQVGSAGNINLTIEQTTSGGNGLDVDFICWGPFSDLTGVCSQLTGGNIEDCSYSIQWVETVNITNAQVGEFYVVLITNYSNSSGTIDFQQTSGSGQADCDILNPCTADAGPDQSICPGASVEIGGSPSASGGDDSFTYSWSPVTGLDDPTSPNPIANPSTTTIYTLTIDDEAGCLVSDEMTVTVNTPPSASLPASYEVCEGENAMVTFDFTGDSPFQFEYLLNGVSQGLIQTIWDSYSFPVSESTAIQLVSISDQNCAGVANASTSIEIHELPDATIGGEGTYCNGEVIPLPIIFEGSAPFEVTYSLNGVPQPVIISGNSSYDLIVTEPGDYEITSISDAYCFDGVQDTSTVVFYPVIDITLAYDENACASELIPVSADLSGGQGGPYNLEWTDNDGNVYSGSSVEISSTTDITLDLIATDACNIPYSALANITIEALPIVDCGPATSIDCLDSTPVLDGSNSDVGSFLWTTTDGNILSNETSEVITIDSPGSYFLEVTSAGGCVGSNSISVASNAISSSVTLSGPEILCGGEIGNYSITYDQDAIWSTTYSIDGVVQPSSTTVGTQFDFTSGAAGVYEIISASYGNCSADIINSLTVVAEENPLLSFPTTDLQICEGEATNVELEVIGTGLLTFEYELNGDSQGPFTTNSGSYILEVNQEGLLTPISISSENCVGEVNGGFEMNIAASPSAVLSNDTYSICQGTSADVLIELTGALPFEITYSIDNIEQPPLTSESGLFSIALNESATVELISVSDLYCEGSVSGLSEVVVEPLPVASISGGDIICEGDSVLLSIELVGTAPFEIGYAINGVSQAGFSTSELTYDFVAEETGTYTLTYLLDALCSAESLNSTEVLNYPPIEIDVNYPEAICQNDSLTVLANASGGMGDGYSFLWTDSDENVYTSNTLNMMPSEALELSLIVNDGCDHPSTTSVNIDVQSYPTPSFLVLEDSLCIGEPGYFAQESQDSSIQCIWTFDDDFEQISCAEVSHSFLSAGYHSVGLSVSTSAGCSGYIQIDSAVYVAEKPIAEFSITPLDGTIFNPVIQFENLSDHAASYAWDFGDGLIESETSPLHTYPGAITDFYTACLSAYNILGCSDSVCQFVEIKPDFLMSIPNAFTPDNDGVNDYFIPVFNDIILADYELRIYNRFGEVVFESDDQFQSWNGAGENGSSYYAGDGVYFYRVICREQNRTEMREFFGEITLLR